MSGFRFVGGCNLGLRKMWAWSVTVSEINGFGVGLIGEGNLGSGRNGVKGFSGLIIVYYGLWFRVHGAMVSLFSGNHSGDKEKGFIIV